MKVKFTFNKISFMSKLFILIFFLVTIHFTSIVFYNGYFGINKTNCMLIYVSELKKGKTNMGIVYKFDDGKSHVEPVEKINFKLFSTRLLNNEAGYIKNCKIYSDKIKGFDLIYNETYCKIAYNLIDFLPPQELSPF